MLLDGRRERLRRGEGRRQLRRPRRLDPPMTRVARAAPLAVTLALLVAALPVHAIAPPSVSTVDPPCWWARHSLNPVRLLVRGVNLTEARAHSTRADIHAG